MFLKEMKNREKDCIGFFLTKNPYKIKTTLELRLIEEITKKNIYKKTKLAIVTMSISNNTITATPPTILLISSKWWGHE